MVQLFGTRKIVKRLKEANYFKKLFKQNKSCIEKLLDSLDDETSKKTVKKILHARTSWIRETPFYWKHIATEECTEYSFTDTDGFKVYNTLNQYFDNDFFSFDYPNLVMADGGAYKGDSIAALHLMSGGTFKYIYAFEPLKENCVVLKKVICKNHINDKVALFQVGLDNHKGKSLFENQGDLALANSGQLVEIDTDIASNYIHSQMEHMVNFLKLDIEGKEKEVLLELKDYIAEYSPDLAICIYHKIEDLWEIPLLIKKINSNYKLRIRHHSNFYTETVCYATVKEKNYLK